MRPQDARVWRKSRRAVLKGTVRGRRSTHESRIEPPRRGSTWPRRHPGWDQFAYYLENAR